MHSPLELVILLLPYLPRHSHTCTKFISATNIKLSQENSKEIKPVNPKGNQPWNFIERTDAEAEASILWPPDKKSQDPDAGKDWWQKKQAAEDEMIR